MPTSLRPACLYASAVATAALLALGSASTALNLGLLVIAYGGFAAVLVTELRDPWLDRRTFFRAVAVLLVVAVVMPPLESRDVWAYVMYGRILGVHHVSPYTTLPSAFPMDPFLGQMDPQWHHTASVYGPLFTAISAAGAALASQSLVVARLFFQALAAASVVGVLVLLDRPRAQSNEPSGDGGASRRDTGLAALVCVGLNPLIIISVVNSGHNDALVGLALLGGVLLATRGRPALAGVAFAAAVLVKLAVALAVVAAVLWLWRRQGLRSCLAASWVFALLVIGSLAAFGGGEALAPLQHAQLRQTASSIWIEPREQLIDRAVADGTDPAAAEADVRDQIAQLAQAAVALACVVVVVRRRNEPDLAILVGAVLLTFAVAGANYLPWYWAWGLPVMALAVRSRLLGVALLQGALLELALFPVAVAAGGPSLLEEVQAWVRDVGLPLFELAVLAGLLFAPLGWRPRTALRAPRRRSLARPGTATPVPT